MGKFTKGVVVGYAAGYMQGARAGQERYRQIVEKARKVADSAPVKKAVGPVRPAVESKFESGRETGRDFMTSVMTKAAGIKNGEHVES